MLSQLFNAKSIHNDLKALFYILPLTVVFSCLIEQSLRIALMAFAFDNTISSWNVQRFPWNHRLFVNQIFRNNNFIP